MTLGGRMYLDTNMFLGETLKFDAVDCDGNN